MARDHRWPSFLAGLVAGLAHAGALLLAFPPVAWWACAFLAPIPLAWAARRAADGDRLRPIALGAALGSLPFWAITQWWIKDISVAGFPPLCALQASWAGVVVALGARFHRRYGRAHGAAWFPLLWVGVEFFRGELFFDGYAWALIGYPLIDSPLGPPAARFQGVYFASFLAAIPAGAFLDLRARRRLAPAIGAAVIGAVAAVGVLAGSPGSPGVPDARAMRVAIVQTNVPQIEKIAWTPDRELIDWREMSILLEKGAAAVATEGHAPALVVLPETMLPGGVLDSQAIDALDRHAIVRRLGAGREPIPATLFAKELLALQGRVGVPFVVGSKGYDGVRVSTEGAGVRIDQRATYNSAFLVQDARVAGPRYDKVRLTPFGEVMPYISTWPWLEARLASLGATGMRFDLSAGASRTVLEAARGARLVAPICFEVTVAGHVRRMVFDAGARRADCIANLTNDGWFGDWDIARAHHLQIARWRCAELDTPMVRAANTGYSALIDRRGRRIPSKWEPADALPSGAAHAASSPARAGGVLTGTVALPGPGDAPTVYARVGSVVGWIALAFALATALGAAASRIARLVRGRPAGTGGP